MKCTLHPILFCKQIQNEIAGACSTYGRRKIFTMFWWKILREKGSLGNIGVDG
jgi:hypothetical protein